MHMVYWYLDVLFRLNLWEGHNNDVTVCRSNGAVLERSKHYRTWCSLQRATEPYFWDFICRIEALVPVRDTRFSCDKAVDETLCKLKPGLTLTLLFINQFINSLWYRTGAHLNEILLVAVFENVVSEITGVDGFVAFGTSYCDHFWVGGKWRLYSRNQWYIYYLSTHHCMKVVALGANYSPEECGVTCMIVGLRRIDDNRVPEYKMSIYIYVDLLVLSLLYDFRCFWRYKLALLLFSLSMPSNLIKATWWGSELYSRGQQQHQIISIYSTVIQFLTM